MNVRRRVQVCESCGRSRGSSEGCCGPTKLFVGSIAGETSRSELEELFAPFGEVNEVAILTEASRPKFSAFVNMGRTCDAQRAIRALDQSQTLPGARKILEVRIANVSTLRKKPDSFCDHKSLQPSSPSSPSATTACSPPPSWRLPEVCTENFFESDSLNSRLRVPRDEWTALAIMRILFEAPVDNFVVEVNDPEFLDVCFSNPSEAVYAWLLLSAKDLKPTINLSPE